MEGRDAQALLEHVTSMPEAGQAQEDNLLLQVSVGYRHTECQSSLPLWPSTKNNVFCESFVLVLKF